MRQLAILTPLVLVACAMAGASGGAGQGSAANATAAPPQSVSRAPAADSTDLVRSTYILGPEDQISIHAVDTEEISDKPVRIDTEGDIRLPMLGKIHAAGLTADQVAARIAEGLKEFIQKPDVTVSILDFRSQTISILGCIRTPGIHALQGRKTLVDVITMAGGVSDDAGWTVKITRPIESGRIPVEKAADDPTGKFSVAEINLDGIMDATNPSENIVVHPRDIITIPRGRMIYILGQVQRTGGFVLRERQQMSALQAIAMAGGLQRLAAPENARILRAGAKGADRTEIAVNLKTLLKGKGKDVPLQPDDILVVPASGSRSMLGRVAETAYQITTNLAVFRP
jgi:polysaccharide export outer membrane protein